MKYANMHLHSIFSDGIYTPAQLCELGKQKGYRAIAVADHNTTTGVAHMRRAAQAAGLETITAMETYVVGLGTSFHMLAYDFDTRSPRVQAYVARQEALARELTIRRFNYCIAHGSFGGITWQDVLDAFPDGGWLCNEQVFATLKQRQGLDDTDYWTFIRQFNRAPVEPVDQSMDCAEMIDIIREAGGVAVLAHPHQQTKYLPDLLRLGLGGVEACHPDIDADDEREARAFAAAHRLYTTGGTDHTGLLGNNMKRGNGAANNPKGPLIPFDTDVSHGATQEEFEALKARIYG